MFQYCHDGHLEEDSPSVLMNLRLRAFIYTIIYSQVFRPWPKITEALGILHPHVKLLAMCSPILLISNGCTCASLVASQPGGLMMYLTNWLWRCTSSSKDLEIKYTACGTPQKATWGSYQHFFSTIYMCTTSQRVYFGMHLLMQINDRNSETKDED